MRKRITLITVVLLAASTVIFAAGPMIAVIIGLSPGERSVIEGAHDKVLDIEDAGRRLQSNPNLEPELKRHADAIVRLAEEARKLAEKMLERDDRRKRGELPSNEPTR